jgi:hypothetical protein
VRPPAEAAPIRDGVHHSRTTTPTGNDTNLVRHSETPKRSTTTFTDTPTNPEAAQPPAAAAPIRDGAHHSRTKFPAGNDSKLVRHNETPDRSTTTFTATRTDPEAVQPPAAATLIRDGVYHSRTIPPAGNDTNLVRHREAPQTEYDVKVHRQRDDYTDATTHADLEAVQLPSQAVPGWEGVRQSRTTSDTTILILISAGFKPFPGQPQDPFIKKPRKTKKNHNEYFGLFLVFIGFYWFLLVFIGFRFY